ncbi:MAG: FAD-binding oxidoreductase [Myxococcota bacterium]
MRRSPWPLSASPRRDSGPCGAVLNVRPVTDRMLIEALRAAHNDEQTVLVHGGQTKLDWLLDRGPAIDTTIDLSALSGVMTHDHGDMTATVQAGTPLAVFQAAVGQRGQRLAIDPPLGPDRAATIGGIFSTDDAGPGRIAYGSLRELCIGATFALVDGTTAKSGSKVIKNVAGYDLCKLFCGARGTLAVITELTVRLHPHPAAESTVRAAMPLPAAAHAAMTLDDSVMADAITYAGLDEGTLWIRVTGAKGLVSTQSQIIREHLKKAGGEHIDIIEATDSQVAWAQATEARRAEPGESLVAVFVVREQMPAMAEAVADWLPTVPVTTLVSDVAHGAMLVRLNKTADAADHAAAVEGLRHLARAHRGHARLRTATRGLIEAVDPFGPLPSGTAIMGRIKSALDPSGRLAPARYLTNP